MGQITLKERADPENRIGPSAESAHDLPRGLAIVSGGYSYGASFID